MKCIGFCVRAVLRVVLSFALVSASIYGSTSSLAAGTTLASGDYLYIGGTPATTIGEDSMYYFQPWAAVPAASRAKLKWSIYNKPYWATFDASTGLLYGKVYAAQAGTYMNITIGATDGTVYASMRSFSITVDAPGTPPPTVNAMATGSTTLDWTPPTENTDGTVLTDLAGYNLYYGTSGSNLSRIIKLSNPGLTRYVVESLPAGTWYFAMTTLSATGSESDRTGTLSTTIP